MLRGCNAVVQVFPGRTPSPAGRAVLNPPPYTSPMAGGPPIRIQFGPSPRRRRRRRTVGLGALLGLIVFAVLGFADRFKSPAPRLPASAVALDRLRAAPWARDLQPAPAVVIDQGPLRHVPYLCWRAGDVELDAYGDADRPAGLEIGLFGPGDRAAARDALAALLPDPEDRRVVQALDLAKDRRTRAGLVFEVTPETAPDAAGAWWVSVYHPAGLDAVRAPGVDGRDPRPPEASPRKSRPGTSVYRRR